MKKHIQKKFLTSMLAITAMFLLLVCPAVSNGADASGFELLDAMNTTDGWNAAAEENGGGTCLLSSKPGEDGNGLAIDFNLAKGKWIQINKDVNANWSAVTKISFVYKYTGPDTKLEVKILDKDDSNFGTKIDIKATSDWKLVQLNIKDLSYFWGGDDKLDASLIKSIWFAISSETTVKGTLMLDSIKISKQTSEAGGDTKSVGLPGNTTANASAGDDHVGVSRLVIDEFERFDPQTMYTPMNEDDSTIKLTTGRQYTVAGNYCMEIEYDLSTTRPTPSQVRINWSGKETLDWSKVDVLKIWVKGDGSGNIFRMNIIDASGEIWSFEDRDILQYTEWKLLSMPMDKFQIPTGARKRDGNFDKNIIRGYEFGIVGRNNEETSGKIYVDSFFAIGHDLVQAVVVPSEVQAPIVLSRPQGNIDFKGFAFVEYAKRPTDGDMLGSYSKLFVEGKVKKLGYSTELTVGYKEFGESYAQNQWATLDIRNTTVEATAASLFASDVLPFIKFITVGNLWVDFSEYTFSPVWGYKGIQVETAAAGWTPQFFMLKHRYDSYTYGGKVDKSIYGFFLRGIYVEYDSRAKILSDGTLVNGTIDKSQIAMMKTGRIENDKVYSFNFSRDITKYFQLRGIAAQNLHAKYAEVNNSDIFNPIYNYEVFPAKETTGIFLKAELEMRDFPFKGTSGYFTARKIDTCYKPRFRRDPQWFDEFNSDLIGYKGRLAQAWNGFILASEYEYFSRLERPSKYRHLFMAGLDKLGWNGFDLFFHYEYRRMDDMSNGWDNSVGSIVLRSGNDEMNAYIFRTMYRFSPKATIIDEVRFEDVFYPDSDQHVSSGRMYLRLEYFLFGNNKIVLETQFRRFSQDSVDPNSVPSWWTNTNDDYFRVALEFQF